MLSRLIPKLPLIPKFLEGRHECAQTVLFSHKLASKKVQTVYFMFE
jgi:hypothetical protein